MTMRRHFKPEMDDDSSKEPTGSSFLLSSLPMLLLTRYALNLYYSGMRLATIRCHDRLLSRNWKGHGHVPLVTLSIPNVIGCIITTTQLQRFID